jgi:Predicted membrane protein
MSDVEDLPANTSADEVPDSEDDLARKLRRGQDRAAERKRKAEEQQKERREKAEAAAKQPKQSKQFQKVLRDIEKKEAEIAECEREIAVIDNDLREADCPRTRVLGKDRFWNRYYWFERNGMPYGGLPNSSTASAGYANGCIWVQGPDELERIGYIDMQPEWQEEYRAKMGMTVPERKRQEEGKTSVFNACQWGYYDTPEDVDALLAWLDPRGVNELKLRKELVNYRDKIVKNMENRKAYLELANKKEEEEKKREEEERRKKEEEEKEKEKAAAQTNGATGKRMTTRGRTQQQQKEQQKEQQQEQPPPYRCMKWVNTMAIEEIGHLHSAEPVPRTGGRNRKPSNKKREQQEAEVEAVQGRSKRGKR